jgi:transglutaminase-like putative cysteine protease
MRTLIDVGKRDPEVRNLAVSIISSSGVSPRDSIGQLRALYTWGKKNLRYVPDVQGVEYIQAPRVVLRSRAGDCDDFTVLLAALAESIGFDVIIKVISLGPRRPFSHVYPMVRRGEGQVPLDITPGSRFGAEFPIRAREKLYK